MKKAPADPTTAKNLEERFDRGEDVLDYFDVPNARVIRPQPKDSATKAKPSLVKQHSNRRAAAVREKSARYRTKK